MIIRLFMSRPVLTLDPDQRCSHALELLHRRGIRHAPVVDKGLVVGVVSERDLLRLLPGSVTALDADRQGATDAPVSGAMTRNPHTIGPNTWLEDAARILHDKKISCLPVLEERRLVGIVTETDLLRALFDMGSTGSPQRFSWRRLARGGTFDLARACVELDLLLTSLIVHHDGNDGEYVVARIAGEPAATKALVRRAAEEGYVLFASEQGEARKAG